MHCIHANISSYIRQFSVQLYRIYHLELPNMCRGREEENRTQTGHNLNLPPVFFKEDGHATNIKGAVSCELCGSKASLYCQADEAFLCRKCDKWVHGANFLAHRHIRCFLCKTCQNLTQRYLIGASVEVMLPTMVSWKQRTRERSHCDSDDTSKSCSGILKMPFLFL